ncbi:MAG TPA: hypothetical protein PKY82_01260 [Pyrinomonadaceae bacterium]|nr:hypothetical protein [Pyrinomonadaceae bacterium]
MAASGLLLNQLSGDLIMCISLLAFVLGIAFDWKIGGYLVGEGEIGKNNQKIREYRDKEIGIKNI